MILTSSAATAGSGSGLLSSILSEKLRCCSSMKNQLWRKVKKFEKGRGSLVPSVACLVEIHMQSRAASNKGKW